MGRPKLLLPWKDSTIIEQTLAAWRQCSPAAIIAVVRPDDAELTEVCRRAGAQVVLPPIAPPHMRDSVQYALDFLAGSYHPADDDVWLLAPADMPNLSPAVVEELLSAHRPAEPAILRPTVAGRRGHPVLFPWSAAALVRQLPSDRGIDALCWQFASREVPCDRVVSGRDAFADVDTPEQYERQRSEY